MTVLALAFINGLGDVAGAALATWLGWGSRAWLRHMTALAAGLLLATTVLSLLPEVVEAGATSVAFVLVGYLAMLVAENLFATHVHEPHVPPGETHPPHPLFGGLAEDEPLISPVASGAAALGLCIHALFDGVAIGAALSISEAVGGVVSLAIFVHKLPEGFGVASILLAAGGGRAVAIGAGVLLGLLTIAGSLLAIMVTDTGIELMGPLLGFATGTLLYVAATDLVPAVNEARRSSSIAVLLLGVGLMLAARFVGSLGGLALH